MLQARGACAAANSAPRPADANIIYGIGRQELPLMSQMDSFFLEGDDMAES